VTSVNTPLQQSLERLAGVQSSLDAPTSSTFNNRYNNISIQSYADQNILQADKTSTLRASQKLYQNHLNSKISPTKQVHTP
jgi:hypothetical protein